MDLNHLSNSLRKAKWDISGSANMGGFDFDLAGTQKLALARGNILVKQISIFDANTAMAWHNRVQSLNREFKKISKPLRPMHGFYLCLFAEYVMADAVLAIQHDVFGDIMKTNKAGCWGMFIIDEENGLVHEKKTSPPFRITLKSYNQLREVLQANTL